MNFKFIFFTMKITGHDDSGFGTGIRMILRRVNSITVRETSQFGRFFVNLLRGSAFISQAFPAAKERSIMHGLLLG